MADGSVSKTGVAVQLSGGAAGPDGIEMDAENGLLVCRHQFLHPIWADHVARPHPIRGLGVTGNALGFVR